MPIITSSTAVEETAGGAADDMSKPTPARSLSEAFVKTAKALQQFGLERIRVVGLSKGCDERPASGFDPLDSAVRVVTEHEFMRDFVFLSRPCIILDAIEDWPAMHKWRSDRYVFDLDGHLPLVEQRSTSSDDDDDDEEGEVDEDDGEGEDGARSGEAEERAAVPASEPRPLGPRKFTIALTPNGRADAVTYVLFDTRDVPEGERETVYQGTQAAKAALALKDHPLLTAEDRADPTVMANLRLEKIFMCAAEVKLTLPELHTMFSRGPTSVPPTPVYIDMRQYKAAAAGEPTPVIAYAQLQNNCLNTEFTHMHADILTNVEAFGTRVFGEKPEAANVWLGTPASVSSMHQDWVENLYPVVRGVKEFILIPPWEGVFVPKPDTPAATFALDVDRTCRDGLTFAFQPYPRKDGTAVPWMDIDITADMVEAGGPTAVLDELNARIDDHESRRQPVHLKGVHTAAESVECARRQRRATAVHPLVARVHPGETLYLPAMWLHRVAQHGDERDVRARARHRAEHARRLREGAGPAEAAVEEADAPPLPLIAAVNYWYNMNFSNPAVVMLQEFGLLL